MFAAEWNSTLELIHFGMGWLPIRMTYSTVYYKIQMQQCVSTALRKYSATKREMWRIWAFLSSVL